MEGLKISLDQLRILNQIETAFPFLSDWNYQHVIKTLKTETVEQWNAAISSIDMDVRAFIESAGFITKIIPG